MSFQPAQPFNDPRRNFPRVRYYCLGETWPTFQEARGTINKDRIFYAAECASREWARAVGLYHRPKLRKEVAVTVKWDWDGDRETKDSIVSDGPAYVDDDCFLMAVLDKAIEQCVSYWQSAHTGVNSRMELILSFDTNEEFLAWATQTVKGAYHLVCPRRCKLMQACAAAPPGYHPLPPKRVLPAVREMMIYTADEALVRDSDTDEKRDFWRGRSADIAPLGRFDPDLRETFDELDTPWRPWYIPPRCKGECGICDRQVDTDHAKGERKPSPGVKREQSMPPGEPGPCSLHAGTVVKEEV